jgi:4-amino-4-deoxy-L-arabinose transferase-like glycosyltransferase
MRSDQSTDLRRGEAVWLACVVLAALVFRAGLASLPRVIRWDEPDYLWLGKSLLTGRGYTIAGTPELHYTPLLPALSGAVYLLTDDPELGTSFWYVLLGALVTLPVYYLARRAYGRRVALLSAFLVAIFPALSSSVLYWGTMSEPLFIFLVYCGLWAAMVALDRDQVARFAIVGGLFGLAYLARPEGLVWLVGFAILSVLTWVLRKPPLARNALARLGVCLAAFALLAVPYALFLSQHSGKWMATGKLGITYNIGQAVLDRDPVLYDKVTASLDAQSGEILWWSKNRLEQGLVDVFLSDPAAFVRRIWRNAQGMRDSVLSSSIFPPFLLAPVVLGWFRTPWSRRRLQDESILWLGILPVLSFLPFHVEVRFLSPAFPAMLIWAAAGLQDLGNWLGETVSHWRRGPARPEDQDERPATQWHPTPLVLLVGLLVVYLSFAHARIIQGGTDDLSYAHKVAGIWLRSHSPEQAAIMSRDLAISLYAERAFVASPRADYAPYLDYAHRKGATYLVVDEHELRVLRPHLAFLLDDANPPPELEPVFAATDGRGRTIVYRIKS